jgi:hypothetical protein
VAPAEAAYRFPAFLHKRFVANVKRHVDDAKAAKR